MTMIWHSLHPRAKDFLGFIPQFLSDIDPRSAKEQLNDNYSHGGGWQSMAKWHLLAKNKIYYPGDPVLKPVAWTKLREEEIYVYLHAWIMIKQKDGSFEVARMD